MFDNIIIIPPNYYMIVFIGYYFKKLVSKAGCLK